MKKISIWDVYTESTPHGDQVLVKNVENGRVEYAQVLTWRYGNPIESNIHHSASIASFQQQYPVYVDWTV